MAQFNRKDIVDVKFGRRQLVEIRSGLVTVWEFLTGFIFTSDGYVCQTSDGIRDRCNDQ